MRSEQKKLKLVKGNKINIAIPMQKVTFTSEGKITEDFIPVDGSILNVELQSNSKKFNYTPTIDNNILHIIDNGRLPVGSYSVTVIVDEPDGTKRRSKWCNVIAVYDDNAPVLNEFDDFPEYAEGQIVDGNIFFFAKGTPGTTDYNELINTPQNVSSFNNDAGYLTDDDMGDYATKQDLQSKQDTVNDLSAIRSGASAGATAYQKPQAGIPESDLSQEVKNNMNEKEMSSNKVSSWQATSDNTHYPSEKLVKDSLDAIDKLVEVEYGVTTYAEVKALVDAGKIPFVRKVNGTTTYTMLYTQNINGILIFHGAGKSQGNKLVSYDTNITESSGWLPCTNRELEEIQNKKITIAGNESSNSYYPSTKAVADYAQKKIEIVAASGTTLSAAINTYYNFVSDVGTLAITFPAVTDTTHISNIVFMLTTGSTPTVTFTAPSGINVIAQDGFSIEASTTYEINAIFNGTAWVVAIMKLNTTDIQPSNP